MVGVKGYDACILDALTRHNLWIVSKQSNANTITHYIDGSLKALRRAERDVQKAYPNAEISTRALSMVAVIGSDLTEVSVLSRGLHALEEAGLRPLAAQQGLRRIEVQFLLPRDDMDGGIKALHDALVTDAKASGSTKQKGTRGAQLRVA
jgi:aspartate kinase